MLYHQDVSYNYTRIKDIEEHINDKQVLFLYVELSITKKQMLGNTTRHQEETTFSEIVRIPLNKAPAVYLDLPDDDYFIELSKSTFEHLKQLAYEDFVSFASYMEK